MQQYHHLIRHILQSGIERNDRTGTGTIGIFGYQMRFDLSRGFPLVTTKKCHTKSIIHELLWFLKGETNIAYLKEHGVRIWDAWADDHGNLGRIYGAQWRSWRCPDGQALDQISQVIHQIKTNPHSRRHLVVAYNPGELSEMALPPCHAFFQFYVAKERLSCQLYQRSADVFLGVPFNIASYALLTHMIAQVCNLQVGEFVHTFGDAHLYLNHVDPAKLLISREPRPLPTLRLYPNVASIFEFCFDDIVIENYDPHPTIKAEVSV